jgi:hypothetical protein
MTSIKKSIQNATQHVKSAVSEVKQTVKNHEKTIKGATAVVTQSSKALAFGKDALEQISRAGKKLPVEGILGPAGRGFVGNPTFAAGKFGPLQKVMAQTKGAVGALGVFTAAKSVGTAVGDIRNAVRTGSRDDITKAVRSSLDAAKATVQVASGGLQGSKVAGGLLHARAVAGKLGAEKAALEAFKRVAPQVSETVAKAAANSALKQVFEGATSKVARRAVVEASKEAATAVGGSLARGVAGSGSRAAAKATLNAAGREAAEAALKAGARAAAGPAAKAAARFAPGLNVAMAAIDTAQAAATLADRNASTGKKVTSVITAVGSIAAATNIPIVSQVGAAVSTVSSIVGAFF